jgi:SAM-dependent methyltransferase
MGSGAERIWETSFGGLAGRGVEIYDEVMVPRMFEPWAQLLVDRLEAAVGEAVLDVACGPGSVTRIVAARVGATGRVTGCDLSAPMLALARSKPAVPGHAAIDYHQAPADRLPVPDGSYDAVTCQQGLQFFSDRPAALREMRRALRQGGRVGIVVWTPIENSPPFEGARRRCRGDRRCRARPALPQRPLRVDRSRRAPRPSCRRRFRRCPDLPGCAAGELRGGGAGGRDARSHSGLARGGARNFAHPRLLEWRGTS